MSDLVQDRQLIITVLRLLSTHRRSGWTRHKYCRILAGWYDDEQDKRVFVPEQVGEVLRWSYWEWEGNEPLAIKMYVRVRLQHLGLGT
jgi:hypothetical protein